MLPPKERKEHLCPLQEHSSQMFSDYKHCVLNKPYPSAN